MESYKLKAQVFLDGFKGNDGVKGNPFSEQLELNLLAGLSEIFKTCREDTERLNFIQLQNDKSLYTGACVFRWSVSGRGWRFHETARKDGIKDIRKAIDSAKGI